MDDGPRELLLLALHHQAEVAGGRRHRDEHAHVGDHPGAAREVELAARDAAVGEHLLAQLRVELGGAARDVRVEVALEGRAEEVRVADDTIAACGECSI